MAIFVETTDTSFWSANYGQVGDIGVTRAIQGSLQRYQVLWSDEEDGYEFTHPQGGNVNVTIWFYDIPPDPPDYQGGNYTFVAGVLDSSDNLMGSGQNTDINIKTGMDLNGHNYFTMTMTFTASPIETYRLFLAVSGVGNEDGLMNFPYEVTFSFGSRFWTSLNDTLETFA